MNILVTGAQFKNKGAQSLLFSVMNELRNRYENVEIFYIPIDNCFNYQPDEYRFHVVFDDEAYWDYMFDAKKEKDNLIRCVKLKRRWERTQKKNHLLRLSTIWHGIDALIDVSGYALSSKFSTNISYKYIRYIREAKKRGIPVILMPQSFGPWKYGKVSESLKKKIATEMEKVDLIYAREQDCKEQLTKGLNLKNEVKVSADTVLQTSEMNWKNVYVTQPTIRYRKLTTKNNVGIIPNAQVFKFGNQEAILGLYMEIIDHLVKMDKEVYIFKHSADLEACQIIARACTDNPKVHLIEDDMNCFEYGEFVQQFDFIIASRYHSIVHAYKEQKHVPALILGWAIKYHRLAELFEQQRFVFDGTNITDEQKVDLFQQLEYLCTHYEEESTVIAKNFEQVQANNCYLEMDRILGSIQPKKMDWAWIASVSKPKKHLLHNPFRKKKGNKKKVDKTQEIDVRDAEYLAKFHKYAFYGEKCIGEKQYEAVITRWYHTIEKGLAYENFRAGFGKKNLEKLLNAMSNYVQEGYSTDAFFFQTALSVLDSYTEKNRRYGVENPELEARYAALGGKKNEVGGIIELTPLTQDELQSLSYEEFIKNRHPMRHFPSEPVNLERIEKALELAQHTPSACNRQGWRTIVVANKDTLTQLLKNQNGNEGFGQEFDKLLVVVGDIRVFNHDRELYQVFMDGGMYAQSVLNALHYECIASVPLSASLTKAQEATARELLHIHDAEMLIMYIGIGNYPEGHCQTTRSERKEPTIEVL